MRLSLTDPVTQLRLVSPKSEAKLAHLGIHNLGDLVQYFPRDWRDLTEIQSIVAVKPDEVVSVRAIVKSVSGWRTPWRRMHLTEALLADKSGNIKAVWFNQPYLKNLLHEGREYYFNGKVLNYQGHFAKTRGGLQLQNPAFELVKPETIHTAGIIPVYQLTEGITQKQFRYWLNQALSGLPQIADYLPADLKKSLGLPDLQTAVKNIHFPTTSGELKSARGRLAFDELFLFQLALLSYKKHLTQIPAPAIPLDLALIKTFVKNLPFELTNSQRLAAWEILHDLKKAHPMNRLLEGEVGSGKTVVAGLAMLATAKAGWQSVLLAPTEILAWQHYQTLERLYEGADLTLALLTRSHKIGSLTDIASGKAMIIIGTHALLQESVQFKKIGLLVVDEQHRFGVKQRSHLQSSSQTGLVPHLLSMTATPIPRTLALAFYGDLDISQLKQLPSGRKKIMTRLVEPEKRPLAYDFIRKQILAGRQVYVVTPLIEESDTLGVKSVTLEAHKLRTEIFPEFQIGLMHGRLKGEEKKQIMEKFKSGQLQILVSTTVIEVGVDVPNASIMLIENAERFGLAQLHQLRGRVGRSTLQSYCLLFAENANESTKSRLLAVVKSTDGFALAEKDLELRGPGEIIGTKQSGYIPFKIAKLSDRRLIALAKTEAQKLLAEDAALARYPLLKQKVQILAKSAHLE